MGSLSFITLLVLLLVLLLGGVGCMKEEEWLVSVQELHLFWDGTSPSDSDDQLSSLKTPRTIKNAAVLELKHQIAPHTNHHFHKNVLLSDEARVSSLQHQINQSKARTPLTSGIALRTLNYVVNLAVGGENMTVIVDTGSDLTWVQCKPCASCYMQRNPLYDPSASPTYRPVPCNSTTCSSLGPPGACDLDRTGCGYALRYGDGSYSRGILARERIGIGETYVEGFIFGCGRSNRGLFGGVSGLVGLGRARLSLISQASEQFGGVFSYCLPSRVYNSSGDLTLGGGDPSSYNNATPIAYTKMVQGPRQVPFYFLNLTSVSVGGVELGFSKGVSVLIDSGTVITRLVPSLYNAVRDEFARQFSAYPAALGFSILDTCYDLSKYEEVRVPKLGLGFEGGVDVNVDATGILYVAKKDASQVCLAMASLAYEDGIGIIGNYQQRNHRVVYDNVGAMVGFGEEKCSYS